MVRAIPEPNVAALLAVAILALPSARGSRIRERARR